MTKDGEALEGDAGAGGLREALRESAGFAVERMPGLASALDRFVAAAQRNLAPLLRDTAGKAKIEPARNANLFRAIGDCKGLTAAIYTSADPEARLLIALDERIDQLIVATIFGDSAAPAADDQSLTDASTPRTAIETALIEEFARALGRALEEAFALVAPFSIALERLTTLSDVQALGPRDTGAAAARFSLPMAGDVCECLILIPQSVLLPFRKQLEREITEAPRPDRRWSLSMETGVRQTRLPVTAILEDLRMSLAEVAQLHAGAVLPLQTTGFESVTLECGGHGIFLCRLGQGEGRYRLEVDAPVPQDLEPTFR